MRDVVVRLRKQLKPDVKKVGAGGISGGSQTFLLWRNRQVASKHRTYTGEVIADVKKLTEQLKGAEAGLTKLFAVKETDAEKEKLRKSLERFCDVFPDAFVITDRSPFFNPNQANQGRPLTAGSAADSKKPKKAVASR